MNHANADDRFGIRPRYSRDSIDCVRRFGGNSESLLHALARIAAGRKDSQCVIAGNGAVQSRSGGALNEGFAPFAICCSLNLGHPSYGATSRHRGFAARSFSIKNRANLPWNALDLRKIAGLCCIQLKLQFSPKTDITLVSTTRVPGQA